MKTVSRNKFLVCFRPVMDSMLDSEPVVVDRSRNHRVLTYTKPSTTPSSVPDTENSIMVHRPGKKTFSHVVKAVVFEILLAKRVKDRKGIDRGSYSSKHNFPVNSHDKMLDTSAGTEGIRETISESNSVPNSTPETSKHQEREVKEKQEGIQRGWSSSNAVFWVVISLAMTIFWGKIYAILSASIWLYFLPRLQQPAGEIENLNSIKRSSEEKSEDDKKIIMEGLLKRKQSRGAFNY
ncbi:uncharacterized protein At5g23160-like [Hibiscus syriacus]|uniref:uncharacterized protein At5g23160-like n=1 Tax=Hibiscus syriacus TaxID=106335 RepID=UPI001924779D|nr:uncharacterized protein At5g23160-like [Hibiscus syriacus]